MHGREGLGGCCCCVNTEFALGLWVGFLTFPSLINKTNRTITVLLDLIDQCQLINPIIWGKQSLLSIQYQCNISLQRPIISFRVCTHSLVLQRAATLIRANLALVLNKQRQWQADQRVAPVDCVLFSFHLWPAVRFPEVHTNPGVRKFFLSRITSRLPPPPAAPRHGERKN